MYPGLPRMTEEWQASSVKRTTARLTLNGAEVLSLGQQVRVLVGRLAPLPRTLLTLCCACSDKGSCDLVSSVLGR